MDTLDIKCMPVVKGIPESHWDCTFESFDFTDNTDLKKLTQEYLRTVGACRYLSKPSFWLYLYGPPGRGKTHYAVALHRAIVAKNGFEGADSSIFTEFRRLVQELRASFDDHTYDDRLNEYMSASTLIVDDVTGQLSDWEVKVLEEIIKTVHARHMGLIITSNESNERFISRFSMHEKSRFMERTAIVGFGGRDRRQG